jgi:hypothetical protein
MQAIDLQLLTNHKSVSFVEQHFVGTSGAIFHSSVKLWL